jgi:hypothetical protein
VTAGNLADLDAEPLRSLTVDRGQQKPVVPQADFGLIRVLRP